MYIFRGGSTVRFMCATYTRKHITVKTLNKTETVLFYFYHFLFIFFQNGHMDTRQTIYYKYTHLHRHNNMYTFITIWVCPKGPQRYCVSSREAERKHAVQWRRRCRRSFPRQQVPNTRALPGSLITGYLTYFYCYFQEHFFYFQEAELRMDVLQQHAALMGGASTTSCPLCHKLFLGSESLVEHMKVHHNDPTTVSQAVVQSEYHVPFTNDHRVYTSINIIW